MKKLRFYCLYSGGKDSTSAASVLADNNMLAGCVTLLTGIAAPDWLPFVRQSCLDRGWPLHLYQTPIFYDDLVRRYGFPGPGAHNMYMNYLKGRGVQLFAKEFPGACLASGARKGESKRRFKSTKEWSVFENVCVWNPIFEWSTEQTWKYFNSKGFARSPCYSTLCISGDCLCGAFASKGEREMITCAYPEIDKRLSILEKETGTRWGERSIKSKSTIRRVSPVCTDCDKRPL